MSPFSGFSSSISLIIISPDSQNFPATVTFSLTFVSFLFTLIGIKIGTKVSKTYMDKSKFISVSLLVIVLIYNVFF